jgi:ribokinase
VIRTAEAGTGCAAIAVDPAGNNAIAVGSGANLLARASQVEDPLLGPNATVLVQMEMLASETADVITRAKAAGARILLNLAPAGALPEAALRAVDILVVNETEGAWLAAHLSCADNAAAIRGCLDVAAVVLTQGADGADIASRDASWHEPARQVEVVDTTAAGDCFVGVLAHQLDCGKSLRAAVQRASIAAALCCANSGSQGSIPIQSEITLAGHLAHPRNNSPHCLASFP